MRNYKKKPARYLETDLLAAIKMVREEGSGIAEAGRAFGIARTTLNGALKRLDRQQTGFIGPLPQAMTTVPEDLRNVSVK